MIFTNRLQVYESLSLASKGIAKFSRRAASRVDAIISTDSTAGSSSSTDWNQCNHCVHRPDASRHFGPDFGGAYPQLFVEFCCSHGISP